VDDREFIAAFENQTLDPSLFTHRNHVRLAWLFLRDAPLLEALPRFANGLRTYATSLGAAGKYHETITWSLLFVIRERMQDTTESFDTFAVRNPDLLDWKSLLHRYYRPETLASEHARSSFLMPDLRAS
jgi:hypothetical protein